MTHLLPRRYRGEDPRSSGAKYHYTPPPPPRPSKPPAVKSDRARDPGRELLYAYAVGQAALVPYAPDARASESLQGFYTWLLQHTLKG